MNVCNFYGRVSSDLEVKYSQSNPDMAVLNFSIAVNRKTKDRESDFFQLTAFGKNAENIGKYFQKGNRISVTCHAQLDKYTDRDGNKRSSIKFIVDTFDIVETKAENGVSSQSASKPQASAPAHHDDSGFMNIPDGIEDELPFS